MASIKSKPLEIVERVVRNMPIVGIEYLWEDTPHGRIYVAFGREQIENKYHGVWAVLEGPCVARPIEFTKDQPRDLIVKSLFKEGREWIEQCAPREMLRPDYWGG